MIHPPPIGFLRLPEPRALPEQEQASLVLRMLSWLIAGGVTLGLHAGLYLAATRETEPPPAPPPVLQAAIMINLAPLEVAAPSQVDNAADGPEANEQEALPDPVEESVAPPPPEPTEPTIELPPPPPDVKPEAVLPPKPPEPAPEPEVKKAEKTEEQPKPVVKTIPVKKVKPKKAIERPTAPQIAQKRGGGPKSDQANAQRSAAPTSGGSSAGQAAQASWQSSMRRKIIRAKRFPSEAKGRDYGVSLVSVSIDGQGRVTSARLVSSSGSAALDREAVAVMYRASPFRPPPGNQATVQRIPMNFNRD